MAQALLERAGLGFARELEMLRANFDAHCVEPQVPSNAMEAKGAMGPKEDGKGG